MGLGDILDGAKDFGAGVVDGAQEAASGLVDGAQNVASTVVGGVQQFASDPVGTVTSVFGGGDPSGNDGGSSNWAAWGHEEIRAMLDDSVHPGTIGEGAQVWNQRSREASDIISTFTRDLRATVSGGWRGTAADAAMASLDPVDQWSTSLNQASDYTTRLVDHSGSAVGQAKDMVPDPVSHNWGRTVGGFALGGPFGAGIDAVAQDRAQEQARLEAVRIMTGVYSTPINENRAAVPTYPQLADPTLQPPEQPPITGPSPGGGGGGGGGGVQGGSGGTGGVPTGTNNDGAPRSGPYHPPAITNPQNLPGNPGPGSPVPTHPQYTGPGSPGAPVPGGPGGRFGPDASAGAPFAPLGGAVTGGNAAASRRGFGGAGGRAGGLGGVGGRAGAGAGSGAGFGPRGSGAASVPESGRMGTGPGGVGAAAGAAGRGGAGASGVPLAGAGAGRGRGGEDDEHRRPSYLVDTDDIFGDGRKVAPPVIGEDPPEYYR